MNARWTVATPPHRHPTGLSRLTLRSTVLLTLGVSAACSPEPVERPDTAPSTPAAASATDASTAPVAAPPTTVATAQNDLPLVRIWKSATCGCCAEWAEHMREAGFPVEIHDVTSLASVKAENGIPAEHQSCHTAQVGDYVIEGHVPADLVARILRERPEIEGLAVPGMPVGSPGMEVGDRKDPYDVLALLADGSVMVYERR